MHVSLRSDIPRRRDEDSDWHDLDPVICETCGCTYHVAKDDASLIWEPGLAWEENCKDRDCHCHVSPVIGIRRP
jgi:hypothetical protein